MRRASAEDESNGEAVAERKETAEVSGPDGRRRQGQPRRRRFETHLGEDGDRVEEDREPVGGGEASSGSAAGGGLRRRDEELDIRRCQLEFDERREARLARELEARLLASKREQRVLDVQLQTLEVARSGLRHQVLRGNVDDAEKKGEETPRRYD